MTFHECLLRCGENKEFVSQFERLSGQTIVDRRTPIEKAIDESCGYDPIGQGLEAFAFFVMECVWIPFLNKMAKEAERASQ